MPKKKETKSLSFEEAMLQLEKTAHNLENSELSLDKSLDKFEEGMKLAKICEDKLNQASGRVDKIMKDFSSQEKVVPLSEDS